MTIITVGIDWADTKHDFCLSVDNGKCVQGTFKHSAESIDEWLLKLRKKNPEANVHICLEQSRGALVFALMKYDFVTLYPLNPKSLARYREAWFPSKAKDDPIDAALLWEMLFKHRDRIDAWKPEPEDTRLLQRLTEHRQKMVNDLKRLGNRLTNYLKEYYPVVLELFPTISRNVVADFLIAYPALAKLQQEPEQELINFFRSHHSGTIKRQLEKVKLIFATQPLTKDRAVIESNSLMVQAIAREIKAINASIETFETKISELFEKHPDKHIFNSLPGSGEVMAPRLVAAMGTNRNRFNSAQELQAFTGIAPVIERSGNSCWTHWRYFCPRHIRQAFIDWAFISTRYSFWAGNFYSSQRSRGKTHSVAIRALAYKWQRIIFVMWKTNSKYDESRYLKALQNSGSLVVAKQSK